ncbi:hypothetical protein [Ochrobactrum sp. AN78]|uniref:hypothetical protein n=1 Tax=Ochrobactrum sp. AN78 TaxID=3039853 RepID=UPI002989BA1A|nr:hypothetical protein [Ochrobactrum sp. AN78]MDH7792286.1 hypothetical protein [Ochrobactrum sp. AN78]
MAGVDENLAHSRAGERVRSLGAFASLWLDGELVEMEDLVLHDDAERDIRSPSYQLTLSRPVGRNAIFAYNSTTDFCLNKLHRKSCTQKHKMECRNYQSFLVRLAFHRDVNNRTNSSRSDIGCDHFNPPRTASSIEVFWLDIVNHVNSGFCSN